MNLVENYPLKEYNTWQVQSVAETAAIPSSVEELQEICRWALAQKKEITVMSGGSNVLLSDKGLPGVTLLLHQLSGVEDVVQTGHCVQISCLAGTPKAALLREFVKCRMSPALFLAGLPGDMGGGVVMNAGVGHDLEPKEFCQLIEWIEYVDLSAPDCPLVRKTTNELEWTYRSCKGWQPGVIARVGCKWEEEPVDDLLKQLQDSNKRRMSTQPLVFPSCGSVFKNPEGDKSGRLIESCGLKGFRIGDAQVSEKHANFIINVGDARGTDIDQVIKHVQKTVSEKAGIDLKTECVYLGEW